MHDPENIHLVTHQFGLRFFHQQIEERSVAMLLKFVTMSMIKELDVVLRQRFAGLVEKLDRFAAGLLVEISLVGNPGAAGIF